MIGTKTLVAYVDVDDTLVRSFGSKRIPMTEAPSKTAGEYLRALCGTG